jgi:hypothetical protein
MKGIGFLAVLFGMVACSVATQALPKNLVVVATVLGAVAGVGVGSWLALLLASREQVRILPKVIVLAVFLVWFAGTAALVLAAAGDPESLGRWTWFDTPLFIALWWFGWPLAMGLTCALANWSLLVFACAYLHGATIPFLVMRTSHPGNEAKTVAELGLDPLEIVLGGVLFCLVAGVGVLLAKLIVFFVRKPWQRPWEQPSG